MMRLGAVLILSLFGGLISVHAAPAPHPHWSVGFHRMSVLDPLDSQPMKAIAFYPSTDTERTTPLGAYQVAAGEDAKVAIGRFPMLMLSHGNTGTPLALHDLATSLARKGFVVVAVLHPGDNYKDHSRLGTVSNLYGRPIQISQAITATLADPMLSPFVDVDQIGVIGYSAGGETALILAGAKPDFERLRRYCQQRPEDRDACTTKGELVVDRDDLQPQADPRIHALMLMAPLSLMFGRHTLADVHVPVLLYSGDGDQLVAVDKTLPPWRVTARATGLRCWPGQGTLYSWRHATAINWRQCQASAPMPMASTAKVFTAIWSLKPGAFQPDPR